MRDTWTTDIRRRIEGLSAADAREIRRTFKAIRTAARARGDDDFPAADLKRVFRDMRRYERRDHVAALRQVYLLCLDPDERDKVAPHSARRAADPNA